MNDDPKLPLHSAAGEGRPAADAAAKPEQPAEGRTVHRRHPQKAVEPHNGREVLRLPFASEFSPGRIELVPLLEMVAAHEGRAAALTEAIRNGFFSGHAGGEQNRKGRAIRDKLAYNCRLGMKTYGIIDDVANFTEVGQRLYELREDEAALYDELARHILLNLNGMGLVNCILDMTAAGREVKLKTTLPEALRERRIDYPNGGTHPSAMRGWLAKAGVFIGSRWQLDEIRLREVLGASPDEFAVLASFTAEQKAFLRALLNMGTTEPQSASDVARLAAETYGVRFPEGNLPRSVLDALVSAGYITTIKTTGGRGAKSHMVVPTEKLVADIIEPMLEQLRTQLDPKLLDLIRKPLAIVLDELGSTDKHVAGLALEALAFHLMRLLGMDYVATRLRGSATGGAEVDLIFESDRLVFSRWQVQCKNTARVSLDDVAKEVGLTHFLKSNVIVMVANGEIGSEARRYANKIMADSNLAIVMLDERDLVKINASRAAILDVFRREARHAMLLKTLDKTVEPLK